MQLLISLLVGDRMRGSLLMSKEAQTYKVEGLVGTPIDYADEYNWAHLPQVADKDVDVFFVYPTVYMNPASDAPAIVPVEDETLRSAVAAHYQEAPLVFEGLANVYEPFYRQSNLCALFGMSDEAVLEFQHNEQRTDVFAALDYYFEHYNQGRPFFLAGHSQGSIMLKIALREYFQEHVDLLERMIAAYAIGFSITTDDLAANPSLRFAEGADDTGVIVSWNTEGPQNKGEHNPCVLPGAIAINPISWTRDETPAPASANLGDRLPVSVEGSLFATEFEEHRPGLADARVDTERGVVVCTTLADRYVKPLAPGVPNIFGPGSLHTSDYPAYWENIRDNVRVRTAAYLGRA